MFPSEGIQGHMQNLQWIWATTKSDLKFHFRVGCALSSSIFIFFQWQNKLMGVCRLYLIDILVFVVLFFADWTVLFPMLENSCSLSGDEKSWICCLKTCWCSGRQKIKNQKEGKRKVWQLLDLTKSHPPSVWVRTYYQAFFNNCEDLSSI